MQLGSRISDGGALDLSGVFPIYFSSESVFLCTQRYKLQSEFTWTFLVHK